ncbi:MAG: hypothetical protein Q8N13_18065 [Acidovorax sp.]|nr:hypothetical protein [Acidovorax sp.]
MNAPNHKARLLTLKVWVVLVLYALLAGLALQVLILPHIFPQLHAGNGLLAGRDWVGFHEQAVAHAQKIVLGGWGEFLLRPDGDNAITGVAAFFYVLFGPHPWVLLPLNGVMFATGGVALFAMLKYLDLEDNEAIIALLPYLAFPSALLQYGQIHKDVFCTAGVLVTLCCWVGLLRQERQTWQIAPLLALSALALAIVSIFRPYFMFPFLGLGVLLVLWHLGRVTWQFLQLRTAVDPSRISVMIRFNLGSIGILMLINLFLYVMSITFIDIRMRPIPSDDVHAKVVIPLVIWQSNESVRSADTVRILSGKEFSDDEIYADVLKQTEDSLNKINPQKKNIQVTPQMVAAARLEVQRIKAARVEAAMVKAIQECRPVVILKEGAFFENMINRIFLKIAVARAGFTSSGGTTAASNIDKGIDFCKNEDLIRYIPRAMQIAMFAPFPSQWMSTEKRNSSAVEIFISSVEMFYCYIAYLGLLFWLFSYKRWTVPLLIPISFAVGLTLLLGLTVANVGTLYRMRFPFAMIYVSIGMAGLMQLAKLRPRWVDRFDSNGD